MKVLVYSADSELIASVEAARPLRRHTVESVSTPDEAWRVFTEGAHPLVLLDATGAGIAVPGLCRRIRIRAGHLDCLIVLVGAADDSQRAVAGLTDGASDWVEKSADPEVLGARLAAPVSRAERLLRTWRLDSTLKAQLKALDTMQLGVTITDLDGVIVYTNDAEARMHGYRREELIGQKGRIFAPRDRWKDLSHDRAKSAGGWSRETFNLRKDGTIFPVRLLSDVVHGGDGEPVGLVTTCEDVSERKRVEAELKLARESLESRVQERTAELLEINARLQEAVLERNRAEKQLVHDAFHDRLTGLPNKALFSDRVERALALAHGRQHVACGVLCLGLDGVGLIRDSLGPKAADEVSQEVARRVAECVRPEDTVARTGGDELMILIEYLGDPSDTSRVARRIREALAKPHVVGGDEMFTTGSVGIALSETGYTTSEEMVRDAHIAMLRARATRMGGQIVFDQGMHDLAVARLKLESQLRQAIDRREFRVQYQPIVTIDDGRIEGFEALARWYPGGAVEVPPSVFIPVAEETGLVLELGEQILRQVCDEVSSWSGHVADAEAPYISVNLSSKELSRPEFESRVRNTLNEYEMPPSRIRFEITESSIVENPKEAVDVLNGLKGLGFSISIDDFGTGYSSLSSLHSFPIDNLKIDRSFISGNGAASWEIVRTIVGLARILDLEVVAEGIETVEQLEAVRDMGCERCQGFLFSRPVDPAVAEQLLVSGSSLLVT